MWFFLFQCGFFFSNVDGVFSYNIKLLFFFIGSKLSCSFVVANCAIIGF